MIQPRTTIHATSAEDSADLVARVDARHLSDFLVLEVGPVTFYVDPAQALSLASEIVQSTAAAIAAHAVKEDV